MGLNLLPGWSLISPRRVYLVLNRWLNAKNSSIHHTSAIGNRTKVTDSCFGSYCYASSDCILSRVRAGSYISIGPGVKIVSGLHDISYLSTSPIFFRHKHPYFHYSFMEQIYNDPNLEQIRGSPLAITEIGDDVWIGSDVKLLSGVKVGRGAVIGCGSIVIRDVPSYSVVAGVPAFVKRMRFSPLVIHDLESSQWWLHEPRTASLLLKELSKKHLIPIYCAAEAIK